LRFSFLVKLDSTSQFLFFENIFYLFYFGWKVIFLLAWLRPHQNEWGTRKSKVRVPREMKKNRTKNWSKQRWRWKCLKKIHWWQWIYLFDNESICSFTKTICFELQMQYKSRWNVLWCGQLKNIETEELLKYQQFNSKN
jgi:hypothetical protein